MNTGPIDTNPLSVHSPASEEMRPLADTPPLDDASFTGTVPSTESTPASAHRLSPPQDRSSVMNSPPLSDPLPLKSMPSMEKLRLFTLTTMGLLLSLLFLVGSIKDYGEEDDRTMVDLVIGLGIGLVIGGYTLNYTRRTIVDFRKGLPRVDELTDRIREKAASSAFFFLIYFNLVRMFFEEDAVGDIIVMLLVYGMFKLWYAHKGELTHTGGG